MRGKTWWVFTILAAVSLTVLGLLVQGPTGTLESRRAEAAPSRRSTKAVLGHHMKAYVATDGSYSFLRPRGWSVNQTQNGATVRQNPKDSKSARVDLLLMSTGGKLNSGQVIDILAKTMKSQYPSFSENARKVLSTEHDITAVVFSFMEGKVLMSGVGVAASKGQAVMWGDIYGADNGFRNYNAAALLIYMMASMNQGKKPRIPDLPNIPAAARSARRAKVSKQSHSKRMRRAAVMTHYWNNFRYIHPKAFRWYARPY